MTRSPGTPESRPPAASSADALSSSVPPPNAPSSEGGRDRPGLPPIPTKAAQAPKNPQSPLPVAATQKAEFSEADELSEDKPESAIPEKKRRSWLNRWQLWVFGTAGLFGTMSFLAVAMLLRLPALPNCPSIFWPLASASMRLYCAQLAANKQTVADLMEAITLVNALPPDHSLRPEVNRSIEEWSQDILRLADDTFNAGKLVEAIAIAEQLPNIPAVRTSVQERVQDWQTRWRRAEAIYREAEQELRQQDWGQAFRQAIRLLSVGNTYWETTKYQELTNLIRLTRQDINKLGQARYLADQNTQKSLIEAMKLADSIDPKSYVYPASQQLIVKLGRQMLSLAETTLEEKDLQGALAIAQAIPDKAKIQPQVQDFITLAQARSLVWDETIEGIEAAIAQAQKIGASRPLYSKAQELIALWQKDIEGLAYLQRARQRAQSGSVNDLAAAIVEAQNIPRTNPRWNEAQKSIQSWQDQIQTIEDQPILQQADQLASSNDVASLQAAIDQAGKINSDRALYRQAQTKIRNWIQAIQRIQDQPYLDQAWVYANSGQVPTAISIAAQIQPGRALYNEAQTQIKSWRLELQAQDNLQEAYRIARTSTPNNLIAAMEAALQVPRASNLRSEAQSLIDQWGQQVLDMATAQANYDLPGAIALARKIPSRSSAYDNAQRQISEWRRRLAPPPLPSPTPLPEEPTTLPEPRPQ